MSSSNLLRYWRELRARFSEIFRSARLNPIGSICWILSTTCLGMSLSFVVSAGPDIQNYLYALIRSDSPSIYGSAYQDSLVRFPNLRLWLAGAFQLQFLAVAAVIVGFSFQRNGSRSVFVSGVVASYLSLVASDLILGFWGRNLSGAYVLENLIANAAGALVVAFVLVTMMIAGQACFSSMRGPNFLRGLAAAFATLVIGVCMSSAVYYLAEFFYRPIPVRLDVVLDAPINGAIGTKGEVQDIRKKRRSTQDGGDHRPFQIFPSQLDKGTLRWNSPAEDNMFVARWNKLSNSGGFEVAIEFYADCFGDAMNTAPTVESNQVKVVDLSEFSISLDAGPAEFGTIDRSRSSGTMITRSSSFAMYSIGLDPGSKRSKTTQFADKDAELTVRSGGHSLGFYVNAILLAASGSGIAPSTRTFTIQADGKTYSIQVAKPRGTSKMIGELACRSVNPAGAVKRERATIAGSDAYLGATVRINKRPSPSSVYGVEESVLRVHGGNGWLTFLQPVDRGTGTGLSGSADFVSFKGNVASLDVDKTSATPRPIDEYHAVGEFVGSFEDAPKVRFAGIAKAFWKNGARENPTKWEKLGWEQRAAMATAIFSIMAGIVGYVAKRIRKDDEIDWRPHLR
ncbi:hypothetical protein [Bradyrhizobium cosmicum]|nr:hypothetical protein [Bradyrhizobium cosmicum]